MRMYKHIIVHGRRYTGIKKSFLINGSGWLNFGGRFSFSRQIMKIYFISHFFIVEDGSRKRCGVMSAHMVLLLLLHGTLPRELVVFRL